MVLTLLRCPAPTKIGSVVIFSIQRSKKELREAKAHFGDGATEAEKAEESDRLESTSENESISASCTICQAGFLLPSSKYKFCFTTSK